MLNYLHVLSINLITQIFFLLLDFLKLEQHLYESGGGGVHE